MTLHETERMSDFTSNSWNLWPVPPHLYFIPPFLLQPSTFMGPLLSFIVSLNPLPSNSFSNLKCWTRSLQCAEFNLALPLFQTFSLLCPPLYCSAFIPYCCSSFMYLFVYLPCPLPLPLSLYVSCRSPSGIPDGAYNTKTNIRSYHYTKPEDRDRQVDLQADRQTDRPTDRHIGRHTEIRQWGKSTDIQADRYQAEENKKADRQTVEKPFLPGWGYYTDR